MFRSLIVPCSDRSIVGADMMLLWIVTMIMTATATEKFDFALLEGGR